MVVRNRCPETGNEEILVSVAKFAERYEGPVEEQTDEGWSTYRPRGLEMRFVVVAEEDGTFTFVAPWARAWWRGPETRWCRTRKIRAINTASQRPRSLALMK